MLYSTLFFSIFMILAIGSALLVIFKRLKLITPFNLAIYFVLIAFWIIIRMTSVLGQESASLNILKNDFGQYAIPIGIGLTSLIQSIVRYPLGLLSGKLHSRKIPIIIAFTIFLVFTIPLIVTQNLFTFLIACLGVGVFSATSGMDTLYFSENWSIKHIFKTIAIISFLPTSGIFFANIITTSAKISGHQNFSNILPWTLLALLVIALVILTVYLFFHHEKRQTMRKEAETKKDAAIIALNYKDVFKISSVILMLAIANQIINTRGVFSSDLFSENEWSLISTITVGLGIFTAVFVSLWLIKRIRSQMIAGVAQVLALLSLVIMFIDNFAQIHSKALILVCLLLFTISVSVYETTLLGTMVNMDHKNHRLVLAIWLSVRTFGYALGALVEGPLEVKYKSNNSYFGQWVILAAIVAIVISLALAMLFYSKRKIVFSSIDFYEHKKMPFHGTNSIWKNKKHNY